MIRRFNVIFLSLMAFLIPVQSQTNAPASGAGGTNAVWWAGDKTLVARANALLSRANKLYADQKYGEAIGAFAEYLDQFPGDAANREPILFRIADSFRQTGKVADARAAFEEYAKEFPGSVQYPLALVRLADLMVLQKDYAKAVPLYQEAIAQTPNAGLKLTAQFALAVTYQRLDRHAEALKLYQTIAGMKETNPYRTRSAMAAGDLLSVAGNSEAAMPYYMQVCKDDQELALQQEAGVKLGRIQFEKGKFEEAAAQFRFARNLPLAAEWRTWASYGLLKTEFAAKDYRSVAQLYATANEKFPPGTEEDVLLLAARSQRLLKNLPETIRLYDLFLKTFLQSAAAPDVAYDRILALHESGAAIAGDGQKFTLAYPKYPQVGVVWYLVGEELFTAKLYAEADKALDRALACPLPANIQIEAYFMGAWSAMLAKDYSGAETHFTAFIAKAPTDARVSNSLLQLASVLVQQGRAVEALVPLERILREFPKARERADALNQSALIYGQQGNNALMQATFLQLLAEYPKSADAAQANYWIGWVYGEQGKFAEAIPYLRAARRLDPAAYARSATYRLIFAYFGLQKPDELGVEIGAYEKARVKDSPVVPAEIYVWTAQKFFEKGKNFDAADYFQKAVDSGMLKPEVEKTARLQLGRACLRGGRFPQAIQVLEDYRKRYDDPADRVASGLELARAYLGADRPEEARKLVEAIMGSTSEGRFNAQARIILGNTFLAENKPAEAVKFFVSVGLLYDDPQITPEALWLASRAYALQGDKSAQQKYLTEMKTRYPSYKPGVTPAE